MGEGKKDVWTNYIRLWILLGGLVLIKAIIIAKTQQELLLTDLDWWVFILGIIGNIFMSDPAHRRNIPSLWTGLGILGTFVALYMSFSQDLDGLVNESGMIDQNTLKKLISGLAQAFSTSIIGIVMSIAAGADIAALEKMEKETSIQKEKGKEEEGKITRSPHQLLYDISEALSSKENKESVTDGINALKTEMEDFRKDVKTLMFASNGELQNIRKKLQASNGSLKSIAQVTEKLPTDFQTKLSATITELSENIQKHTNQLGKEALEEVRGTNKSFIESILTLAESNKKLLTESDQQLKEKLESLNGQFKDQMENLTSSFDLKTKEIAGSFKDQSEKMAESSKEVADAAKTAISETQKTVSGSMETLQTETQKSIAEISASFSGNTLALQTEMTESTAQIKAGIKEVFAGLQNANQSVADRIKTDLEANFKVLEDAAERLTAWQKTAQTSFEDSAAEFRKAVNEYQTLGDTNTEILEGMQKQLGLLQTNQEKTDAVLNALGGYEDRILGLESQMDALDNATAALGKISNQLSKITA